MHLSGSPPDRASLLVGDASFWISLIATGQSEHLLDAFDAKLTITEVALVELERGRPKGRVTADAVHALMHRGSVGVVHSAPDDESLLLSFLVGPADQTLDDGEAATLVCASRLQGTAVIDERKATKLAAVRFPQLRILSTLDLLLDATVSAQIGRDTVADAIFNALVDARMRVPSAHMDTVVELLGLERAAACSSIPRKYRSSGNDI